ncbi:unnamed protein product, partial [Adineta steineri]
MSGLNLLSKIIEILSCAFGDLGWNTTGITVISSPPNMGASGVFVGLD